MGHQRSFGLFVARLSGSGTWSRSLPQVRAVNEPGLGEVWPEMVVLLHLDAATGLARQEDPDRIGAEGDSVPNESWLMLSTNLPQPIPIGLL